MLLCILSWKKETIFEQICEKECLLFLSFTTSPFFFLFILSLSLSPSWCLLFGFSLCRREYLIDRIRKLFPTSRNKIFAFRRRAFYIIDVESRSKLFDSVQQGITNHLYDCSKVSRMNQIKSYGSLSLLRIFSD